MWASRTVACRVARNHQWIQQPYFLLEREVQTPAQIGVFVFYAKRTLGKSQPENLGNRAYKNYFRQLTKENGLMMLNISKYWGDCRPQTWMNCVRKGKSCIIRTAMPLSPVLCISTDLKTKLTMQAQVKRVQRLPAPKMKPEQPLEVLWKQPILISVSSVWQKQTTEKFNLVATIEVSDNVLRHFYCC